jgi:hypothetical protein
MIKRVEHILVKQTKAGLSRPFIKFRVSIKSYFLDKIDDYSQSNIVGQLGEVTRCIAFFSC